MPQSLTIPTLNDNTIWLTDEQRVDRDSAIFGQLTWDIGAGWGVTCGMRGYHYDNSLQGYYGYSANYQTITGYASGMDTCGPPGGTPNPAYAPFHFAPCTNLNTSVSDTGHTEGATLSYKFDPDRMVYFTFSTGFRPGGVNRVYDAFIHAIYPPYRSDELKNYELGWKTQWFDDTPAIQRRAVLGRVEQLPVLLPGPEQRDGGAECGLRAQQRRRGELRVGGHQRLLLSGSATFLDAELTQNFCGTTTLVFTTNCPNQKSGAKGSPIGFADGTVVKGPYAPSGTRLPGTPRLKLNVVSRYTHRWTLSICTGRLPSSIRTPRCRCCSRPSTRLVLKGSSIWVSCRHTRCSISRRV